MKKNKQPGENFSLKTRKTEDPLIMRWINSQSNLMDSLRYLIENEIVRNGVRNLQAVIPSERNFQPGAYPASALPEASQAPPHLAEPPAAVPEEEIDDDDIEAWI